jgi:hypothetical protein
MEQTIKRDTIASKELLEIIKKQGLCNVYYDKYYNEHMPVQIQSPYRGVIIRISSNIKGREIRLMKRIEKAKKDIDANPICG